MTEEEHKEIARQLRRPEGEYALQVGKKMNEGNFHINEYSIQELNAQANEKILEIGMGNGFFVKGILNSDKSIRYIGCDYSKEMVDEASKLNYQYIENGQAQFHLSRADKLPVENNSIDKILTINTIYFWDNPKAIFEEIHRVLKPNGKLIVSIRPNLLMDSYPFTKYGFKTFSEFDLSEWLVKNRFATSKVVKVNKGEQAFLDKKMMDEFLIITATITT